MRLAAAETSPGEAMLVGIGEGLTSTYRGVKQLLGVDEDEMRGDAAAIRALRAEHPVATTAGSVIGNVADPVNLVPMGKAASVAGMAGRGAVGGAAAGGLGYVDEEAGQTRLGNTALGTGFGAAAGGVIAGGINASRALRGRELIPLVARTDADAALRAGVVPGPEEVRPKIAGLLEDKSRQGETLYVDPKGQAGTKAQMEAADLEALKRRLEPQPADPVAVPYEIKPRFAGEPIPPATTSPAETAIPASRIRAAAETPAFARTAEDRIAVQADPDLARAIETPGFQRTAEQVAAVNRSRAGEASMEGSGAGTVSFLGTGQIARAARGLAGAYQRYAGAPLLELAQRNPGSALGGVGGAAAGYQSADDDAPMTEKLGRAAVGFALGAAGAKAIGRIPTGTGEKAGELLSRWFLDHHGLPAEYVSAKKARQILTSQIASDFLDVAREAHNLGPGQRQRLYRMLQGEAPRAGELLPLNNSVREKITKWGQRMVDYGLLDADTFRNNVGTYLHREYASKLNPASETGQRIGRQIRMLGEELRPRGVLKEVPEKEAGDWTAKGWEIFGKPRGGRQTVRWQLTKEQRLQMGEIEDAAYAVARTGSLMSNDIAAFKLFDDIAVNPRLASEAAVPGWVQVDGGRLPGTRINRFGNLEGKYVPPEILKDLTVMDWARAFRTSQNPLAQAFRGYQRLNAWWKTTKTALNPVVHTNNVVSNVMLYDLADADYRHLAGAAREFVKRGPAFKQAQALGVFDADMVAQELRDVAARAGAVDELAKVAGNNPVQGALDFTRKVWRHTGGRMIDWYQKEDSFFRLGIFMDRIAKGATPEDAAKDARRWLINYDIQAPGVNVMRATATPFIAYTYRAVPLLAEAAAMRPWKFAKWAAIGWAMNEVGERKGGGDTAKERELMSGHQKGNIFGLPMFPPQQIKLPTQLLSPEVRQRIGVGDTAQYLDVTRYVPGGDVFDMSGENQFIPGAPAPLQPSFGAAGSIAQAGFGIDAFRGKRLPGLGASKADDARIKGSFLAEQFLPNNPLVPGSFAQDKIVRSVYGKPTPAGDQLPLWQALAQTLGVKIRPADLDNMTARAMLETKQDVEAIEQQIREAYKGVTAGKMSEKAFGRFRDEKIDEAEKKLGRMMRRLSRSAAPAPQAP